MTPKPDTAADRINTLWKPGPGGERDMSKGVVLVDPRHIVPRSVTQHLIGLGGAPNVRLTIEVDDESHWRCTEVTVTGHQLVNATIAGVDVTDLATAVLAANAFTLRDGTSDKWDLWPDNAEALFTGMRRTRRRRGIDLEEVARIYTEAAQAGDAAPVMAVMDKMGLSARSTAGRYVQQARAAGLLPPTTPGKAQA